MLSSGFSKAAYQQEVLIRNFISICPPEKDFEERGQGIKAASSDTCNAILFPSKSVALNPGLAVPMDRMKKCKLSNFVVPTTDRTSPRLGIVEGSRGFGHGMQHQTWEGGFVFPSFPPSLMMFQLLFYVGSNRMSEALPPFSPASAIVPLH